MRKQTKLWTTKDGRRIRICDMSDSHLENSIRMLERMAVAATEAAISAGFRLLAGLRGEMAIMDTENELDSLMSEGIAPEEINELYNNLLWEKERRNGDEAESTKDSCGRG
jgi:hypothetical protein